MSLNNPSGRAILVEITALPASKGDQIGAVCLLTDVSEAQRMEQLRRDYVANISHELRTPLTGIRGMIEPLMDGYVDTEEERQSCYGIIQRETVRLEKLVGEMLDMSRLQDGRATVELERLELPGILEAAARSMSALARDAGVELGVETDGSRLACMGNEDRIEQVLVILLDNAIDFTPRGGRVTVFARDAGQQVDRRRARYRLRHRAEGPADDLGALLQGGPLADAHEGHRPGALHRQARRRADGRRHLGAERAGPWLGVQLYAHEGDEGGSVAGAANGTLRARCCGRRASPCVCSGASGRCIARRARPCFRRGRAGRGE